MGVASGSASSLSTGADRQSEMSPAPSRSDATNPKRRRVEQ